MKLILEQR